MHSTYMYYVCFCSEKCTSIHKSISALLCLCTSIRRVSVPYYVSSPDTYYIVIEDFTPAIHTVHSRTLDNYCTKIAVDACCMYIIYSWLGI